MATRVNTKFVVILSLVLVASTGGLAAVWYFVVRQDPQKQVEHAERYLEQGLTERAIEEFGKALSRRPDDVRLLLRFVEIVSGARVSDVSTARRYLRLIVSAQEQAFTQEPRDPDLFNRLASLYARLGREFQDFASWNALYERAQGVIDAHPEPQILPLARRYRGIAQVNRIEKLNIPPELRQIAIEDLTAALESDPEDRETLFYLAAWHVLEAREQDKPGGIPGKAAALRDEADRISARLLEAAPDDPDRVLDRIRILRQLGMDQRAQIGPLVDQLEQRMLATPADSRLVIDLVELLPSVGGAGDDVEARANAMLQRAERLLRTALQQKPADLRLKVGLASVLRLQRRPEEARDLFKEAYDQRVEGNVFEELRFSQLHATAGIEYAKLLLDTSESFPQARRQAALAEVDKLVTELVADYGENPSINLILGKLAIARQDWATALAKLDQANAQWKESAPEPLFLSAQVRARLGEVGAAAARLEQLLAIQPSFLPARYELARFYLQLAKFPEAQAQIDQILRVEPDRFESKALQATLLAQTGRLEEAIEAYRALDTQAHPEVIPALAQLCVAVGRPDEARDLLLSRFKEAPADLNVLQRLIQVSRDAQEAIGFIQTARAAGAPAEVLDVLESQLERSSSLGQIVEDLINREQDPLQRHVKLYRLYERTGRVEQAEAELAEAARINPDHAVVIESQFDRALAAGDWQRGQALVARAGSLNLDMAQGMFYAGRLDAARGRWDDAVAAFRRGLSLRPIYSEGWRMLGDALAQASDLNEAKASYQRALEQRPNNTEALVALAGVLDAQGQTGLALEQLRTAARFAPTDRSLWNRYLLYEEAYGNVDTAVQARRRIAASEPGDTDNLRALAMLLAKTGQPEEAQAIVDQVTAAEGVTRVNVSAAAALRAVGGDSAGAVQLVKDYVHNLGDKAGWADWIMFARFLVSVGQQDQGLAAYRQAIALEDPQRREATRELADLLFEQRRFDEATPLYKSLWETHPDDRRVGQRFTEVLVRTNQLDEARAVLSKVVEDHGQDTSTLVLDALLAKARGNTEAAMASLDRAVEIDPRRPIIYFQRAELQMADKTREPQAMGDLNKALQLDPDFTAARWMLASLYLRRGEVPEAIGELVTLTTRQPRYLPARQQLARIYADTGQRAQLQALLEETAKLFPADPTWLRMLAQMAVQDGRKDLAVQRLTEALRASGSRQILAELVALMLDLDQVEQVTTLLDANREQVGSLPLFLAFRGRALAAAVSPEAADPVFAQAVQGSASFLEMVAVARQIALAEGADRAIADLERWASGESAKLAQMAIALMLDEAGEHASALERLRRIGPAIAESAPYRQQYSQMLASTLHSLGDHEQALQVYREALEADPNDVVTLNNAAYMLAQDLGRPDEALPMAQRALRLAPDNPMVMDTLGWSLLQVGQVEPALDLLQRSVNIRPSAASCLHLAEAMLRQGDQRGALAVLNRAKVLAEQSNNEQVLLAVNQRLGGLDRTPEEAQ
jgi:tetratricopeptide (TPR) repeat protein